MLRIIVVLVITNIAVLLFWARSATEKVVIDDNMKINSNKAIAIIDGKKISYDEWMDELRKTYGKKQLKTIVDREVVRQLANKNNIKVDEKVIDREIAYLTTVQGVLTEEQLERLEKKWRNDIIYRYQLEALLTADIPIDEEEIRTYFDGYHKQYDFIASMQLSHIVVKNMETAEKIMNELNSGASFPLIAKEYSLDLETKDKGGYLGYFTEGSQFLPKAYYEKANSMEEHTYSQPFKTDNGIAILYLHRKLPDITFTYEEMQPYIRSELALEKAEQTLTADPLWNKIDVEWVYEE